MSIVIEGVTLSDVASQCHMSDQFFRAFIDQGVFPSPDMRIRNREGYSIHLSKQCVRTAKKMGLLRVSHVAQELQVTTNYLFKLIREGRLFQPSVRAVASKFYYRSDMNKIRRIVAAAIEEDKEKKKERCSKSSRKKANAHYEKRRAMGRYSMMDVANMAGVSYMTVIHYKTAGRFSAPKLKVKGYFGYYYTQKQADRIVEWLKENSRAAAK